jgi:voltage-gated potassium channel Kch
MTSVRQPDEANSSYELFMGILTMISLGVMAWLLLAADENVRAILVWMDTLFCFIFLLDFARSLRRAPDKRAYLLPRGILDLLGSIPAIGLFRVFRVFRLARVARLVRGRSPTQMAGEFLRRRAQSAVYVITLAAIVVLLLGSTLIVRVEGAAEGANITTAGDAIWWAFVTITTVGYGDHFPVTEGGRFIALLTMATGIGIFGVVTSLLASVFVGSGSPAGSEDPGTSSMEASTAPAVAAELAALRAEVAALRAVLVGAAGPSVASKGGVAASPEGDRGAHAEAPAAVASG